MRGPCLLMKGRTRVPLLLRGTHSCSNTLHAVTSHIVITFGSQLPVHATEVHAPEDASVLV